MALSMTGFGTAEVQWETWSCIVEIRSVNHRFLDINCRLPSSFQKLEQELKKQIKSICSRGKIDCTIRLEKDSGDDDLRLNTEEVKNILKPFVELKDIDINIDPTNQEQNKIKINITFSMKKSPTSLESVEVALG